MHILATELMSLLVILPFYRISHHKVRFEQVYQAVTHIEVCSGMFEDELCGVGFVLTVTDVHLELISLRKKKTVLKIEFNLV